MWGGVPQNGGRLVVDSRLGLREFGRDQQTHSNNPSLSQSMYSLCLKTLELSCKEHCRGYPKFPKYKIYPKDPYPIGALTILQLCFILKYLVCKFVLFSNPSFANLFYAWEALSSASDPLPGNKKPPEQVRRCSSLHRSNKKQDHLRMNNSTGSNNHLRSIDLFRSMIT